MAFAHISTARAVLEQRLLACGGAIGVVKLEKKNFENMRNIYYMYAYGY